MRLLTVILLAFFGTNLFGQVDPEQIYQAPGRDYVLLSTDTLNSGYPINGIYVPVRLRDSLYFKTDSLCHGIFGDGRPDPCVAIDDMGCFTVIYGGGDSTVVVCPGDTMNITYPEPGMGGASDTLYYFWYQTDGGTRDTVTLGEGINYVSGDNVTITQGATNLQWDVPDMRDTCIHTMAKLNDSTAILYDCNGVARGTASFSFNECELYSMTVSNGIGSDTVFFNKCTGKDTVVFYPPTVNDMRLDSVGQMVGDSIALFMKDTSDNFYDTLYIHVPSDSIDTDSQSLYIDTTTALFYLSRDPTATPDLLELPWKDAIRDNYAANYTDSMRHNGYVGINRIPLFALDVQSSDVFNEAIGRFRKGGPGTATIRLERADTLTYDLMNWGSSFDIRRSYPFSGGSTEQMLRLDTTTTGRIQHYIWHDDEGYFWATDYGQGYHVPTDPQDTFQYMLSPRGDGKFLEIPFSTLVDSLAPNITLNDITNVIDSIELDSFRNLQERRTPYHIAFFREDSLISDATPWDTLVLKNGSANRWIFLNDSLNSVAIGKNARADNFYNTSLGALAFQFLPDTITESVSNSQVDTTLNVIGGLSTFISHLNDLGYTTGQAITFNVELTSGEMPFIDTTSNIHAPTGLQTFIIYSSSQLKPYPAHPYDSTGVGSFDLTASQYITFSTSIGAMSQPDKNRQVVLGDTLLEELRIGDSIRIKADTFYVHDQLMRWDSSFGQFIPASLQGIQGYDFAHGSVIWWDTTGQVERFQEDSLNFYWSKDSMRLGIGTRDPVSRVHIKQSDNFHPDLLTIENDLGHSNIRIKPQSERNWLISARDEGLLYIGSPTGPQIALHHGSTEGFQIDSFNIFSFGGYGNGSKASHIETFDGAGSGPVELILGINSNDGIKTLSFDSLGAQLGIALSIPTLDSFFVDANDSLIFSFQGENKYYSTKLPIPTGPAGDSLGTAWADGQIVVADGTKKGKTIVDLHATSTQLYTPDEVYVGGVNSAPTILELGLFKSDNQYPIINMYSAPGFAGYTQIIRGLGADGAFTVFNTGTGGIILNSLAPGPIQLKTGGLTKFQVLSTGQLKADAYTSTTFDGTLLKVLGVDASGNIIKTNDLSSFVSASPNIYTADGTLTGSRKISTGAYSTTFESTTAGSNPIVKISSTQAAGTPYLQVLNATNGYEFGIKSQNLNISNGTNNTIVMQPGAGSNRMYFSTGGNIGIGTTTPAAQLEIETASGAGDAAMIKLEKMGGWGSSVIGQYYGAPHPVSTERGLYIDDQNSRWLVQEANGKALGIWKLNPGYTLDVGKDNGGSGSFRAVGDVVLGTLETFRGPVESTTYSDGVLYIRGGIRDANGSYGNPNQFLQWADSDLGDGSGTDAEVVWSSVDWTELTGIPAGFNDGVDNVNDADADPNNEFQTFSGATSGATNHQLILSNSGGTQTFTAGTNISFTGVGTSNLTINSTGGGASEWTDAGSRIYPTEPTDLVVLGSNSALYATENLNIYASQATQAFWGFTTSTSTNFAGLYFNNTNMTNSLQRAGDIQSIKTTNTTGAVSIGYYEGESRRQAFYSGTAGTAIRGDATNGVFLGNHTATSDDLKVVTSSSGAGAAVIGHEDLVSGGSPFTSDGIYFYGDGVVQIEGGPSITIGSGGTTTISDDVLMGASDKLELETTSTYAQIGHADNIGATDYAYIRFYDQTALGCCPRLIELLNLSGQIRMNATTVNVTTELYTGATYASATPTGYELYVFGDQFSTTASTFTTSDSTVKRDIEEISNPYDIVNKFRPVSYRYKPEYILSNNISHDVLMKGFIAQDYQKIFPEDVTTDILTGKLAINSQAVLPYTTAAVQQLIKDKTTMESTIAMQKDMIDTLIGEVQKLSNRITKLENE